MRQLKHVQGRVRPRVHVFGHVHEAYGATTDGVTLFLNAATCPRLHGPLNAPLVVDVPISQSRQG